MYPSRISFRPLEGTLYQVDTNRKRNGCFRELLSQKPRRKQLSGITRTAESKITPCDRYSERPRRYLACHRHGRKYDGNTRADDPRECDRRKGRITIPPRLLLRQLLCPASRREENSQHPLERRRYARQHPESTAVGVQHRVTDLFPFCSNI